MRRSLTAAALLAVLALTAVPARAAGPQAGCPPPFQGPLTFEQIIERWPPPPDFPDPTGVLDSYDRNDDDRLCVMEPPHGPNPAGPINVIDNVAAT
jgi:hypothetical protein